MIKMSNELKGWLETYRELGNSNSTFEETLEGVKEMLSFMFREEVLSEEEIIVLQIELEDIMLDYDLDFIAA